MQPLVLVREFWIRKFFKQLGQEQKKRILILCENSSSIKLSKNSVTHCRCKHIDVRYHFLRDLTKEGVVDMEYCSTQEELADIMTKTLKLGSFCKL